MKFINFLLVFLAIFFLVRLLFRALLPSLLRGLARKMNIRYTPFDGRSQGQARKAPPQREEGDIKVAYVPPKAKKQEKRKEEKKGEFVEFEEIKTKHK